MMNVLKATMGMLAAAVLALALAAPQAGADERHDRGHERPAQHAKERRHTESVHFRSVGEHLRYLPAGHVRVSVGINSYYYYGGMFYRHQGPDYVVVRAPIGAHVGFLPTGYVGFWLGPRHFFYVNSTYYLWNPGVREYVVVDQPQGAPQAVASEQAETSSAAGGASETGEIFAYPNNGQSDEQTRRDRYECHEWASDQSGYDPSASNPPVAKRDDYRRAMTACLVGRGYTVR
ncbi:MAG TPA: DUF6515 family protein [Gammaproteobacteria bacterium]|nr:DUF6515 family protein [Gammaproteobacteria bacterium]